MEPHTIVFALLMSAVASRGFTLYGEEKRQGLIPFPRVGRSFLPAPVPREAPSMDAWAADDEAALAAAARYVLTPRLGRRKRSVGAANNNNNPTGDDDPLTDLLQRSPWALVAYKANGEKKGSAPVRSTLSPRLGRKRSSLVNNVDISGSGDKRSNGDLTPRLGRAFPSSILDGSDDNPMAAASFTTMVERSGNNNFSPRLGRSAAITDQNKQEEGLILSN